MNDAQLVIATGLYPPDIGGPATYAVLLEAELPQRNIIVSTVPFTKVRSLPKIVRHISYTWHLWRASKTADVILALDPISVGLPALMVATLRRRPLLIRLGGDYAWEQGVQRFGLEATLDQYTSKRSQAKWQVRFLHRLQAFVCRRAKHIIVPSQYLQSIVRTWGIATENLRVIYSVVSLPAVIEEKAAARRRLQLTSFTIVTAARLTPWKGVGMLIDVVAALKEKAVDVHLLVIGTGPQAAALKQQVIDKHVSEQVTFLGQLSKPVLYSYLQAADVLALNTAYEGLSHLLLEAMSVETPIITTAVGGNGELLTNNKTGLLLPYNDCVAWAAAIEEMIQAPAAAQIRAAAALEQVQQTFLPQDSIAQTTNLIKSYAS